MRIYTLKLNYSKDADSKEFQRINDAYRRIIEDVQFTENYARSHSPSEHRTRTNRYRLYNIIYVSVFSLSVNCLFLQVQSIS